MRNDDATGADTATALKCALAAEVLRSFGSLRFAATGWSMLPAVWPGDTLLVERVTQDQLHIGEIVLLGREGKLCAHRLVSIINVSGSPQWITQGDGVAVPDPPATASELLGRVTHVIRAGRHVAVSAKLSLGQCVVGKIVRRSYLTARLLVYLHGMFRDPENLVMPCQG